MPYQNCPADQKPLAQSSTITTPRINNLNYTNQDFWSIKTRLVQYIQEQFGTEFNDFVEGDIAVMLMEIYAFVADTLSFKIDQIANEIFIDTVTEIENAFRLCKLVGFQPLPPIASRSMWTAAINNVYGVDIVIPFGTQLSISSQNIPINIEIFPADQNNNPILDQDIVIPAGSLVNSSIIGLEGKTITDQITGTGSITQSYQLAFYPVVYDSVRVQIDGVSWTQVDYFTDSQPRREYRVEFDSSYRAYVIFGNNQAGLIPSVGSQIVITYRQGGGTIGNIVTGSVTYQIAVTVDGIDFAVPVILNNYTKGEFGYDGDTLDDIRQKLPAYLRTQNRCVTGLDYKTLSDQFATPYQGQVGKSTAVLRNYGCAANVVDIYVLAKSDSNDLEIASDDLKTSLQSMLEANKMLTDSICVRDGSILLVDVVIDVTIDKFYRKFEDEIRARITSRINDFFSLSKWDYGLTLKSADLVKKLSDITEITDLTITFSTIFPDNGGDVVTSRFYEIIRFDTLTLSFMYI